MPGYVFPFQSITNNLTGSGTAGKIAKFTAAGVLGDSIITELTGKIGVNQVSPDGTFHVHTGSAGSVTAGPASNDLVVESSTDGGFSVLVPNDKFASMTFGSPAVANGGLLQYKQSTAKLEIGTNLASGVVGFMAGAFVEGMRLHANGRLGIGAITAPDGLLHIFDGSAGVVSADVNADNLIVESSGAGGISIFTPDASSANFYFGGPGKNNGAIIRWEDTATRMTIGTNLAGAEIRFVTAAFATALSINSSGNLVFADAKNIIVNATTGTQIATAASQKLGVYGVTPVIQPAGTGETVGFVAGAGTAVLDDSTFTGNVGSTAYNLNDTIKALKQFGLMAA